MHDVKLIRNSVILGHGNSGKTTLTEALLFTAGVSKRRGKVNDESSLMDFEPEEAKRKISISTAFCHLPWKKREIYLHIQEVIFTY